jgi:cyanophycinase
MTNPKGKLIIIGGAEDKGADLDNIITHRNNLNFVELEILSRIVEEAGGKGSHIEVITTASMVPHETANNYLNAFKKLGCDCVGIIDIRERKTVTNKNFLRRIQECDAVVFSGGNQLRLSAIFGGTEFLKILLKRFANENFVVAGTSAGAMASGNTMIYEGEATTAHLKGQVKITTGLGFIDDIIIDTHFEKRGRFNRLAQVVATNPSCIGFGLGENTGMLITEGNKMEAIGSGLVIIIDGHDITHSNIADIPEGNPISIENLKVHFCEKGNGYMLHERKFLHEVREGAVVFKQVEVE